MLIALFHDPVDAVWVLIFITVYQQFENPGEQPPDQGETIAPGPASAPQPS